MGWREEEEARWKRHSGQINRRTLELFVHFNRTLIDWTWLEDIPTRREQIMVRYCTGKSDVLEGETSSTSEGTGYLKELKLAISPSSADIALTSDQNAKINANRPRAC
ncbi:hypothetical protein CLAFUW4_07947 [Fulvia fulva]|uniref:Uncharacterized protein n=1 Tax=Passalora fulva TaxID=5499 RepID=A0A9Q8P6J2_PASFU|nr:uncharacterized protein CLAFUR5_08070 [Fulvia fulva]KAK4628847.1 hypothetical protein CLAFUR4_07952 [Fulvia fulva]KAK4630588.1 hypothetical protein CLAFUR0_07949 [Fulvia fulva]UJO15059.1 hypothetical protein CLAFUR5_08070 [Fulvia fulva]WPV12877.1 hypothetical protein CLAFUW4_07947 [Fulvia fulva]WPV27767.1 hypothetical protein CLAFUW7_07948 [Fulvia fulva]